jgi:hypothetical protein
MTHHVTVPEIPSPALFDVTTVTPPTPRAR